MQAHMPVAELHLSCERSEMYLAVQAPRVHKPALEVADED